MRGSLSYPTECASVQRKRMPQHGTVSRLRMEVLGTRSTSRSISRALRTSERRGQLSRLSSEFIPMYLNRLAFDVCVT